MYSQVESSYVEEKAVAEIFEEDIQGNECQDELPPFDPTDPEFLQAIYRVEKQLLITNLKKEEPISYTGHSAVFKAYSQLYHRDVAVKIIDKKRIPALVADKFLTRELDITSRAHHPHISNCLSIFCVNANRIAIVTEFCPGGTLSHMLERDNIIPEPKAARIFRQLVEAVQYLHNHNVAHRDIKLQNIFLDENCDVRLGDFGFARVVNRAEKSTSFCGTMLYSSPSIRRCEPYDPFAADWYAAGVVLYAMVTGQVPWDPIAKQKDGIVGLRFPPDVPSQSARFLLERLLTEDDVVRGGYKEIVESEWMRAHTNGKWIMADKYFVYEMQAL